MATSTSIAAPRCQSEKSGRSSSSDSLGPIAITTLNVDEQGVDARRHVAFRSGSPKNLRVKSLASLVSEREEAVRPQIEFSAVDLSPEKDLQHRLEVLALATDGEERCPMEGRPFQRLQILRRLAKALDRGKGQNWLKSNSDFGMKTSPKGEAEKRSCMRTSSAFRTQSYIPPWACSPGDIELRLQHPVKLGRLGRHNDDRESRAPPWPPLKPVATEVRCGIELSPCSVACPSGTIYTSFWPNICAGLHAGTSAASLSVGLPFEFGFTAQTAPPPG
ncbi:hypothetical protein THAOC_11275 [Thalassiosira oceanica]|uniref:Uncharacterized protein n=1 Tax=Thalassiosira oceanica TaxID=159749 RepID=K0SQN0_THAOC|nr:hypothetical protein THAOC_11275 [Thalassiosira oceanica]|eukprot:EJK67665.1 hypothetical protein THAOC_11275 [Thalassiosira oceanica]